MLRPHVVFQQPIPIDLDQRISIDTPDAWTRVVDTHRVSVLPLVDDLTRSYRDGWCTYTYEYPRAPELEIICGGINSKTPAASAIWRQGNLLHFGFEQSPAEMNDAGKALLVNSVCYISRFTEDRPVVRPFKFSERVLRPLDRGAIDRLAQREDDLRSALAWSLSDEKTRKTLEALDRNAVKDWYTSKRPFVRHDERGRFVVDEEAESFGIPPNRKTFIPAAMDDWLENEGKRSLGRKLLMRYVSGGPGEGGTIDQWREWWKENRPYLFFTDAGGFVWKIDPLAKKRQVPTQNLKGRDRASKPPIVANTRE